MARPASKFRFWTRDELVAAVRGIEEGLATGAQTVTMQVAGTVAYVSRSDAQKTLRDLYDRIDTIDGIGAAPRVRQVRVIARSGL